MVIHFNIFLAFMAGVLGLIAVLLAALASAALRHWRTPRYPDAPCANCGEVRLWHNGINCVSSPGTFRKALGEKEPAAAPSPDGK